MESCRFHNWVYFFEKLTSAFTHSASRSGIPYLARLLALIDKSLYMRMNKNFSSEFSALRSDRDRGRIITGIRSFPFLACSFHRFLPACFLARNSRLYMGSRGKEGSHVT